MGIEAEVESLRRQNADLLARCQQLETTIRILEQERRELRRRLFGRRSEKAEQLDALQEDLFQEATREIEAERRLADTQQEDTSETSRRRRPRGRRALRKDLPRKRKEYALPPEKRLCTCCQEPMEPFGADVTEELEYIPASAFIIEHARIKYSCRRCQQGVAIAEGPARPIEKGIPGPGMLAHVVVSKYGYHLPLYRLEQIFDEQGLEISRKTMCDWIGAAADLATPIVEEMKRSLLKEPLLQTDDTPVPYQDRSRKGQTSRGYLWSYTKPWGEVVYDFTTTRSRAAPQKWLGKYQGYLQADGYVGYKALCESGKPMHIGCMAHVRRKIFEAQDEDREATNLMLAGIQKLYRIERRAKESGITGEALVALRMSEVLPVLDTLRDFFEKVSPRTLPKSLLGRAMRYALDQWPAIIRYTAVAEAEIDNNSCEHTMRAVVLGRKNWLFAGSVDGGRRAAVLYSLITTCKRLEIDPAAYMRDVFGRVASHPMSRIAELTPRAWAALRAEAAAA